MGKRSPKKTDNTPPWQRRSLEAFSLDIIAALMEQGFRFTTLYDATERREARTFWERFKSLDSAALNVADGRPTDSDEQDGEKVRNVRRARDRVRKRNRSLLLVLNLIIKNGSNRKESIWQLAKKMAKAMTKEGSTRRKCATTATVRRSSKCSVGRNK